MRAPEEAQQTVRQMISLVDRPAAGVAAAAGAMPSAGESVRRS